MVLNHDYTISCISEKVKEILSHAEGGHDWLHIERVCKLALYIAEKENADIFVVHLSALLHDIADAKFYNGDETLAPKIALEILLSSNVPQDETRHIIQIIENISFKGGSSFSDFESLELNIVRDADRLDALGAIGIARAFNYGGFKNRKMYDPDIQPNLLMSRDEYKNNESPTINHFYEKLILLKDLMKTEAAKEIAQERHDIILAFLKQFSLEVAFPQ